MVSPSLLVLALFGPALAPAPHAAEPTVIVAEHPQRAQHPQHPQHPQLGELRSIAWRDVPRARAPLAVVAPAAAPPATELREPFDVTPAQRVAATTTVDPWMLREPFAHGPRQIAAPAATTDAAPVPAPPADGLREPGWAR